MTLTTFHNFDLLITRAGERYRAIVMDASTRKSSLVLVKRE